MPTEMAHMHIVVPRSLRSKVKAQAAARGMTLAEWMKMAEGIVSEMERLSPSTRFDMGEVNTWSQSPEKISTKDAARLLCWLCDTWNLFAATPKPKE